MKRLLLLSLLSLASAAHALTTGQIPVQVYNGTGFTTTYVTLTDGQVLGKTSGVPAAITPLSASGTLALAGFSSITGTIPAANGGSGQTSLQASINALVAASGALSQGDVFYYNGTNFVRLAAGTSGYYLKTQGAGANPIWAAVSSGITIGSTVITSGTDTYLLQNNAGTLGQLQTTGSGSVVRATDPTVSNITHDGGQVRFSTTSQGSVAARSIGYNGSQLQFNGGGGGYVWNDSGNTRNLMSLGESPTLSLIGGSSSALFYMTTGSSGQDLQVILSHPTCAWDFGVSAGIFTVRDRDHSFAAALKIEPGGAITLGASGTAFKQIKRATATLVAGTVTVTDTDTTANSHIEAVVSTPGGTVGFLSVTVSAGSGYTITSSSILDTSALVIKATHF